jgi:hypothetical protein
MRKKKQKGNSILKTIVTMKLANNMNCSYEEAAVLIKNMSKHV